MVITRNENFQCGECNKTYTDKEQIENLELNSSAFFGGNYSVHTYCPHCDARDKEIRLLMVTI